MAVRRTASLLLAYARPSTSFLPQACQDVDARNKCLVRRHHRRVFGDIADISDCMELAGWEANPCHGERCRRWNRDGSLCGLRGRKEPTGGSLPAFRDPPRYGYKWLKRWRPARNLWIIRGVRIRAHSRQTGDREAHSRGPRRASGLGCAQDRALPGTGNHSSPTVSTVHAFLADMTALLRRLVALATQRFEKEAPNLLWQMDFKGWVRLGNDEQCHPLTVVDDHSRFVLCCRLAPINAATPFGVVWKDLQPLWPARGDLRRQW